VKYVCNEDVFAEICRADCEGSGTILGRRGMRAQQL
jgi:hypothetical protein